jgi:hypothetical protein
MGRRQRDGIGPLGLGAGNRDLARPVVVRPALETRRRWDI